MARWAALLPIGVLAEEQTAAAVLGGHFPREGVALGLTLLISL